MKIRLIQIALLTLSVSAITTGVLRGETADILRKATLVCLECVGIG